MSFDENEISFDEYILRLMRDDYTFKQIKYLVKKKYGLETTIEKLEEFAEKFKKDIEIEKELKKKQEKVEFSELIFRLNSILNKVQEIVERSEEHLSLKAVSELNRTIMNLSELAERLEQIKNAEVSNYYIPINSIRKYVIENFTKIIDNLTEEEKKKLNKLLKKKRGVIIE